MKRIIFVFLFTFWCSAAFALSEVNGLSENLSRDFVAKTGQVLIKQPLAVLDFENLTPLMKKHNIGATVSSLLTGEMSHSTIFRLVERKNIKKIMGEVELSMTGAVSADEAVKAGELSGARYLLAGTVSDNGETITIAARIISTEKGEVIAARTVTVSREEMIKTAEEVYWSAFQGMYGISVTLNVIAIIPNDGRMSPVMSFEVGYKPWRYLRVGAGFIFGTMMEFRSEEYRIDSSYTAQTGVDAGDFNLLSTSGLDVNIQHNTHVNLAMVELYVDGLLPLYRWLTVGARFAYWVGAGKMANIEQEIHGFPVPTSLNLDNDDATQDYAEQRIVVNAAAQTAHMFNPQVFAEFLVSKRISINFRVGYLIALTIKPVIFYTADDNRHVDNKYDESGVFPRYPYYNFARDKNDERITANISGVNISLGVGLHI